MTKKIKDTLEQKVARTEARLAKERAALAEDKRRKRNSQLTAMGVLFEIWYKSTKNDVRVRWRQYAAEKLKGHTLERVLSAFDRIEEAEKKPLA